jgi:hypothetical protein
MNERMSLTSVTLKTIVVHSVTYMLMGLIASTLLNYEGLFGRESLAGFMRPFDDRMIMAGPLFQPIRGLIFGLAFYPLREVIFAKKNGWLILWWTLVALGILSTFGPSPGSIEGAIYTRVPLLDHLTGLPEVVVQALLLSGILYYWINHPEKKWLTWVLIVLFLLLMALPVLGLLVS